MNQSHIELPHMMIDEIQPRLIASRLSPSDFDDDVIHIEDHSVLAPNVGLNSRFN
jgi:hypothetical protein